MKLLPAGPQPIALLPAAKTMTDEELKAWWEERFAKLDIKQLFYEAFAHQFIYHPFVPMEVVPGRYQKR